MTLKQAAKLHRVKVAKGVEALAKKHGVLDKLIFSFEAVREFFPYDDVEAVVWYDYEYPTTKCLHIDIHTADHENVFQAFDTKYGIDLAVSGVLVVIDPK